MARGEIKKESKGRKSEKNIKEKPAQQPAYVAAEVISKKKDKDRWYTPGPSFDSIDTREEAVMRLFL